MKKVLILIAIYSSMFSVQNALASDDTLSRSCLKNNPMAVGETDANLIEIYGAYCDKKNKDSKNSYLAKAAQRFQQIGKNWKALQVVNELESQNLRGNTITDVKFLASASLANDALNQMRTTENRYLTSDVTYPLAKKLVDNITSAKSSSILLMEKPVQTQEKADFKGRTSKKPGRRNVKNTSSGSVSKKGNPVSSKKTQDPASSGSSSGNPFGFTQK